MAPLPVAGTDDVPPGPEPAAAVAIGTCEADKDLSVNFPADEDANWLAAITPQCSERERQWLHAKDEIVIPAGSLRFVPTVADSALPDQVVVSRSHSARPGREWIVPSCVLKPQGARLLVPVCNVSRQPLRWAAGAPLATMEALAPE